MRGHHFEKAPVASRAPLSIDRATGEQACGDNYNYNYNYLLECTHLGNFLWTYGFHPVTLRICLSQTLWNPDFTDLAVQSDSVSACSTCMLACWHAGTLAAGTSASLHAWVYWRRPGAPTPPIPVSVWTSRQILMLVFSETNTPSEKKTYGKPSFQSTPNQESAWVTPSEFQISWIDRSALAGFERRVGRACATWWQTWAASHYDYYYCYYDHYW